MKWYKQLHWQIIAGLIAGLCWGLLSSIVGLNEFTSDFVRPFGTIFVNLLKLIAIPLILTSLVTGICSLNDTAKLSRMGVKTILIYLCTTVLAISTGLLMVNLFKPGRALPDATRADLMSRYSENLEQSGHAAQGVLDASPLRFLVDIVPDNLFLALSDNSGMLQVVFIALLIGLGTVYLPDEKGAVIIRLFDSLNDMVIVVVNIIMKMAPLGVFALMAVVIIDLAGESISDAFTLLEALGWYSITVVSGLVIHVVIVYSSLIKLFSSMSLANFFRAMRPAILLGFSTSSSAATLPVTMKRVEKNLGVHEEVSSFVLPVGATINMDGTSLYQAVAAVFIAQALGMDLGIGQQLTIVLTATMASVGAAGVPGAGIIMVVIVLQSVQVPVEGIALILGVDRILDMIRTAVNITGDAAVSVVVASTEGLLGKMHLED